MLARRLGAPAALRVPVGSLMAALAAGRGRVMAELEAVERESGGLIEPEWGLLERALAAAAAAAGRRAARALLAPARPLAQAAFEALQARRLGARRGYALAYSAHESMDALAAALSAGPRALAVLFQAAVPTPRLVLEAMPPPLAAAAAAGEAARMALLEAAARAGVLCCALTLNPVHASSGAPARLSRLGARPAWGDPPAAVDPPPPWRGGGGYVLYLGRLAFEKGASDLPRLAAELARLGLRLAVAGPPEDPYAARPVLRAAARGLLDYHGPLPRARAMEMLARAEALVAPSRSESFSLTLMEAVAAGAPAAAYAIPPIAYYYSRPYLPVALARPGDAAELARLAASRPGPREPDERALRGYLGLYTSWERVADAEARALRAVAGRWLG